MTPKEKILREALAQAKYRFNEIDCETSNDYLSKLADQGMEDAEKAKQEADLMKDGPSEEDKFVFDVMAEAFERKVVKLSDKDISWLISKLKKYMGIE